MSCANESKNRYFSSLKVYFLVVILLSSPLVNFAFDRGQSWDSNEERIWVQDMEFNPHSNLTHINSTTSSLLKVPYNHTITSSAMTISPTWNDIEFDNSLFGKNQTHQWNGTYTKTEISDAGEHVRLQRNYSLNKITDFENVSNVPSEGWMANGLDNGVWNISQNNSTFVTASGMTLPSNGHNNSSFLSTTGEGDLISSMHTCLRSPAISIPRYIHNYSISFKQWLALDISDGVWLEYLDINQTWIKIPANSNAASSNNLNNAPDYVWSGESNGWKNISVPLDNIFSSNMDTTYFQLCVETSNDPNPRGGLFIDELVIFNEGDDLGSWFHGNLAGDYLSNSRSNLIIPLNLTSIPFVDEVEVNINWDMQGSVYDYLTVDYSIDNGSTWNSISGNYGIPGLGIWHNGQLLYGESSTWVPIYMSFNHNFSNTGTLNNTLLKFSAYTNQQINYGGSSSSGWEGVAIDNIVLHQDRGSISAQSIQFNNFNTQPTTGFNSADGWLTSGSSTPNQWQWTDTMGLSARELTTFSFDEYHTLPSGWSVWSQDSNQWEHGELSNSAFYGPNKWYSGDHGVGIFLNGQYSNEMLTHLYSPEYSIPADASSRLSFRSWVCTEANWDGGAVSVSTDGGLNWWYLPAQVGTFHDQISTVNSNSPLYGEGIFDGSSVSNGCQNSARPFDLKQYDISNLSGINIKFRYTFFSDQLIELDGWYIDDAGIEIDIFESNGSWVSSSIYPDDVYGWGQLDGFVNEPNGSQIRFDILDAATEAIIDNYSNLTLPVDLQFSKIDYPSIKIKAVMNTSNNFVTPTIETLEVGVTSYFDAYHMKNSNGIYGNISNISISNNGRLVSDYPSLLGVKINPLCPMNSVSTIIIGTNVTQSSSSHNLDTQNIVSDITTSEFTSSTINPLLTDNFELIIDSTGSLYQATYIPNCVQSSSNLNVSLGSNEDVVFSWPSYVDSDYVSQTRTFTSMSVDGISTQLSGSDRVDIDILDNQVIELSYHLLSSVNTSTNSSQIPLSMTVSIFSDEDVLLTSQDANISNISYSSGQILGSMTSSNPCPNKVFNNGFLSDGIGIATCTIRFHSSGNLTLNATNLMAVSLVNEFEIILSPNLLNSVKNESSIGNMREIIEIPVNVVTKYGSAQIKMECTSYLHLIDRVEEISLERWLPEKPITVSTSHIRFDPLTMSEVGYFFDRVKLIAADGNNMESTFEIEVNDLYFSPNFIVTNGSEKVWINESQSTVNCNEGYCEIDWIIHSNWSLDDIDDISWMAIAFDSDGLETGPGILKRETQFNEVENDLEIIDVTVLDYRSNMISDWTNSNWPYRLDDEKSLYVEGKVRFEGIADEFVDQGDAEIEVLLHAIPPKNNSGGPDEWIGAPVDWSSSWFTEVGVNGEFSLEVQTPNQNEIPSNTRIGILASLSRIGPVDELSDSSIDATSEIVGTTFIFDVNSPEIASINIYDPSGLTPADGHIWTLNQDIPIQITIQDDGGMNTELEVWTWAEYTDDQNSDGIMDADEYRKTTVSINYASTYAELDIPAVSWQEVKGPFESGRLSIVLDAEDLAGNSLQNGSQFGSEFDFATILVQDQLQTFIDSSSLSLDLIAGQILPTHQHTFEYTITDYNGIESLDEIQLALLGRDLENHCFINYFPRTEFIEYDSECFDSQPEITVVKQLGIQRWHVETSFSIGWNSVYGVSSMGGIPSLKFFDEGQDLRLGTSLLRLFEWTPNTIIQLDNVSISDLTLPTGLNTQSEIWVSPGDYVKISNNIWHNGTLEQVNAISNIHDLNCTIVSESSAIQSIEVEFSNGIFDCLFHIPEEGNIDFYHADFWAISDDGEYNSSSSVMIYIDRNRPVLTLELGDLLRLNSDRLEEVYFDASVSEATNLSNPQLRVLWNHFRNDTQLNSMPYSDIIPLSEFDNFIYHFQGLINLNDTNEYNITEGDELVIWLELEDNSGQGLIGFATKDEPLIPKLTWIEFEPIINLVELTSENPVNGESLLIATRIINIGLDPGTVTIELSDNTGLVIDSKNVMIDASSWAVVNWEIEAWTTGDIELIITLVNYSESKTLKIENIEEFDSSQKGMMGVAGLVTIFVIVFLGGFGYLYYQKTKELEQYTKHHLENIRMKKQEKQQIKEKEKSISEEE